MNIYRLLLSVTFFIIAAGPSIAQIKGGGSLRTVSLRTWDSHLMIPAIVTDSDTYVYSGGRGGDLTTSSSVSLLPYDSIYRIHFQKTPASSARGLSAMKHYNAAGMVDTEARYLYSERYVYSFNSAGKVTVKETQASSGSSWQPASREMRYYNASGADTLILIQMWKASAWTNSSQTFKGYNSGGNQTSTLIQNWDNSSASWTNGQRQSIVYGAGGLRSSSAFEIWDAASSSWMVSVRNRWQYNAAGVMTSKVDEQLYGGSVTSTDSAVYSSAGTPAVLKTIYYTKSGSSGTYAFMQRQTSYTNAGGDMDSIVVEDWASTYWRPFQRTLYEYNSHYQHTRQLGQFWTATGWVYQSDHGNLDIRYTYYPATTTSVPAYPAGLQLSISPIPAGPAIRYTMTCGTSGVFSAAIIDIAGRMVRNWNVVAPQTVYSEEVDTRNLTPGVYYLNIDRRGERISRPFVIR